MALTDDQRKFYENTLSVTKKEISDLEGQIQDELAKVKERLAELQNGQKAARHTEDKTDRCRNCGFAQNIIGSLTWRFDSVKVVVPAHIFVFSHYTQACRREQPSILLSSDRS